MTLTVTHDTTVSIADDGDSEIGSDEWNAAHIVAGTLSSSAVNYTSGINSTSTSTALVITVGGSERLRVDNNGFVHIAAVLPVAAGGTCGTFSVATDNINSLASWAVSTVDYGNGAFAQGWAAAKTRGGSATTHGIVQSGDSLWYLDVLASDGAAWKSAAEIAVEVDGTPGVSDMPGRIIFKTTPDGAASVVERMRIASNGKVTIGTTSGSTGGLTVTSSSTLGTQILFANLPSTDPGATGRLWNSAGTVKIST